MGGHKYYQYYSTETNSDLSKSNQQQGQDPSPTSNEETSAKTSHSMLSNTTVSKPPTLAIAKAQTEVLLAQDTSREEESYIVDIAASEDDDDTLMLAIQEEEDLENFSLHQ